MEVPDARERQSLLSNEKPPPRDAEQISLDSDGLIAESPVADLDGADSSADPLEQNKQKLNTLFGFRPFGYHVAKKPNRPVDDGAKRDYSGTLFCVFWACPLDLRAEIKILHINGYILHRFRWFNFFVGEAPKFFLFSSVRFGSFVGRGLKSLVCPWCCRKRPPPEIRCTPTFYDIIPWC
jgi:hypothetical protein